MQPHREPSASVLATIILLMAGSLFLATIIVPAAMDAIEWAFNIGGRRKP